MAGTAGIQVPFIVNFIQTAAGAANNDFTLTRQVQFFDAAVVARAAQAGGSLQVFKVVSGVATALTDAVDASVNGTLERATLIGGDNVVDAGGTVRFTTVGAATLALAYASVLPESCPLTAA